MDSHTQLKRYSASTPEACWAQDGLAVIDSTDVTSWIEKAFQSPRKRYRLCAHEPLDPVHEMIICLDRGTYIRPHKHLAQSESMHVIDGFAQLVLFDEEGAVTDRIALGPFGSGRTFFYRTKLAIYHTLWIESPCFVVHETTLGPHRPEASVFAPWSPDEDSPEKEQFLRSIVTQATE